MIDPVPLRNRLQRGLRADSTYKEAVNYQQQQQQKVRIIVSAHNYFTVSVAAEIQH